MPALPHALPVESNFRLIRLCSLAFLAGKGGQPAGKGTSGVVECGRGLFVRSAREGGCDVCDVPLTGVLTVTLRMGLDS